MPISVHQVKHHVIKCQQESLLGFVLYCNSQYNKATCFIYASYVPSNNKNQDSLPIPCISRCSRRTRRSNQRIYIFRIVIKRKGKKIRKETTHTIHFLFCSVFQLPYNMLQETGKIILIIIIIIYVFIHKFIILV